MLIALYKDHTELPFNEKGKNPFEKFSEEKIFRLPFKVKEENKVSIHYASGRSKEICAAYSTWEFGKVEPEMYSFLIGLDQLKIDKFMAHVSLLSDEFLDYNFWVFPKKIHIKITTCTEHFSENGLPILYDKEGLLYPEIKEIWTGNPETTTPYELISDSKQKKEMGSTPRLWTKFFLEKISR